MTLERVDQEGAAPGGLAVGTDPLARGASASAGTADPGEAPLRLSAAVWGNETGTARSWDG